MRVDRWLLFLAVGLLLAALGRDTLDQWVSKTQLPSLVSATSVEMRDRNGELLRVYTVSDGIWRLTVRPDQVDANFLKMLIMYEDQRFYSHSGVDVRALARAAGQAIWHREIVSGGSTLTMQVARLLEDSGTGRLAGKLRQIRVALALERHLTKQEILQLYLLHAPYGGNLEGVRAATLSWFGKEPKRLTSAEAALLVALPQAPEHRRPDRASRRAAQARDRVLVRLAKHDLLAPGEVAAAQSEPIPIRRRAFPALAPHLADRMMLEAPEALRHDLTLDAGLQRKLEHLAAQSIHGQSEDLSIAIVIADHNSGHVLGSVGSAGYGTETSRQGFVDMTRAKRSPGSTLKPLVYAMAFDRGLAHPQTMIDDRPVNFGAYAPQNFDGLFRGELRVADALRQSLNIPVLLLLEQIGPAHLMSVIKRAGVEPELPGDQAGLAVALGGVGVSLNDLVQIYAMLGQGGQARQLVWRQELPSVDGAQILNPAAVWHVGDVLSTLPPPTGAPAQRIAYKTGTSYGHRDAWAVGYDGRHVVGVWIGRPDGTPVPGAFGGVLAAPILFEAFDKLKDQIDQLAPPPPDALIVTTASLPKPLQRFIARNAIFSADRDAPKLIFPPDGVVLELDEVLPAKVRDGKPPFTWFADGDPILMQTYRRDVALPIKSKGFSQLSVIDAEGRASRVAIELR